MSQAQSSPNLESLSIDEPQTNAVQWALGGTVDGDEQILIDAERSARSISKRKAIELVSSLAGAFEEGSVVCVHAANDVLYPILVLAILASGCIYTGSNPVYTQRELKHHLDVSEARYVVTTTDLLKHVAPVVGELGGKAEVSIFSDLFKDSAPANETYRTLHDLKKPANVSDLSNRLAELSLDATATLMATSGSTGLPKLAARSHSALLAEAKAIASRTSNTSYSVRKLICLPIYHAFAFPETVFTTLRLGQPTYILKRFGDAFSYRIRDHQITDVLTLPSMLLELAESAEQDIDIKADLQTLRTVYCGGAPLVEELKERFLGLFYETPRLVNVYGMTECGWIAMSDGEQSENRRCVGSALEGLEIRLNERAALTLDGGREVGELSVMGNQIMTAYKNGSAAIKVAITQCDWLRTGDIGYLEDDKVYLVDRAKTIIKIDGFAVSPTEFEYTIRELSPVQDVAVISSGPDSVDEHPIIFIARKEGEGELTNSQVRQHLTGRLSRYKVAKCRIRFVEKISRGKDGEALREELRKTLM
ncbi:AMP-dependent synthetase and ligase [Lecanosticta acicola]|uniref:AMP-dependent synthetase and ligase n=1 Tax=Lecanosticta acicola TaxID=111012 RepID=A0AAI8W1I8_9PEZI|nr:AMP-dependent synthetase and ligase [Lecanosticta acicola]